MSGVPHDRNAGLAALLAAVLPARAAAGAATLTSALDRLAGLVADDAPDTLGAAQRAVQSVIAALKVASDGDDEALDTAASGAQGGGLGRVMALEQQAMKQQATLTKLTQASKGIVSK